MAVHAVVSPAMPSAPDQGAHHAKEEEEQEQRDQAAQETKPAHAVWMPERHHAVVRINVRLGPFGTRGGTGRLDVLRQPVGHARVVGEYAQAGYDGQQHKRQDNSENNTSVHFCSL